VSEEHVYLWFQQPLVFYTAGLMQPK